MDSTPRNRPVGGRPTPPRSPSGGVCLAELRARLVRRFIEAGDDAGAGDEVGDGGGADAVRDAVDAAVRPLAGTAPLVDVAAVRSAGDGDLVWCAQAVQRAINVLEGARSALAAEAVRRRLHARRGEASGAETLANATGLGSAMARRVERDAQTLGARPLVADVLGRGEINADQAVLVAGADVPDDVRKDLCRQARNQTADQTRQTVRAAEVAWRQENEAQRRARQRAARSASMWVDSHDGMWHLRAKLDALTGDAVNRLLVTAIERNWRSDKELPESKRRSVQQRAADALAWLLTATCAERAERAGEDADTPGGAQQADDVRRDVSTRCGAATAADARRAEAAAYRGEVVSGDGERDDGWVLPSPTQMIVLTTLDNLRSGSPDEGIDVGPTGTVSSAEIELLAVRGAAATTQNGTALGVADARKIACDTRVIPVVMGGKSEVLDVGRATRTIPPAIRKALIARDQRCVWPNCERAPVHCDGHHIRHWIDNGPTSLENLALLCHAHHQRLHEYNLMLHPPTQPAPPGDGWTVTPAAPSQAPTPVRDHTRKNR